LKKEVPNGCKSKGSGSGKTGCVKRCPMGVAANPKASRQNQKPNGKTKNLTAKPKISRQNQKPHAAKPKPHGKTKNPTRQTKNLTPKPNRATGKVKYFDRKSHKKCQKLSNFMVNTSSVNSS